MSDVPYRRAPNAERAAERVTRSTGCTAGGDFADTYTAADELT
ncbi:MAG: hypothetical protein M5T61_01695 [Acidimicrobiia bacterium]|nr:hypothetical protein [Acidimicrobiia bacterium]